MENPIFLMDDLGGKTPYFRKHPYGGAPITTYQSWEPILQVENKILCGWFPGFCFKIFRPGVRGNPFPPPKKKQPKKPLHRFRKKRFI